MNRAEKLAEGLRQYCQTAGFKKAVLGLSGGVDSALVAKLAAMALGPEQITGLILPNPGISSDHSLEDAKSWAETLGISHHIIPIDNYLASYNHFLWKANEQASMNLQARVRMTILYHFANSMGAMVLGTGNKTELKLGYFTKYGDGGVDLLPIGSLYKTEVWELGNALGLPENILQKNPSAELKSNHTDEEEIGMPYSEIDSILKKFEAGGIAENENEKKLELRIKANTHKCSMPPILEFN